MAVFRIERTRDYTVMSNHHLRNHQLSLKAKGLLSMMLSLPDDWNYTTRGLAKICKEGVDAIGGALRELESAGYIVRHQLRDRQGRISDTEYVIYEQPQPRQPETPQPDTAAPDTDSPDTAFPYLDKPDTEKPAELNIEKSNTQKSITQRARTDSIPFREPAAARPPERKGRDAISLAEMESYRDLILENIEYADRNTLWNAAEAVEKQWNSQLARRWVLTIPREIPPDQYAVLVREFCQKQFVSKGMIADFAIHDPHPPGHNPHAHVMLTMRAMDEHGKWLPKSRKVYDLDENGERIKLPSGRWKSHKEDTVDWNDQKYCEIWRHEWEVIQNRYLEANDRPERVDLRSYARQGLDIIPTVHEGAAVRQMEKRGIQTNIGNLNREIRAANRLMKSIRQLIQNLKGWITELGEKRKELLAQKAAEEATLLPNLLMKYMEIRKEERKDWTRSGQNRGTSQDLKAVSEALSYLQQKGLSTVEDLEAFLESSGKSAADYRNQMKPKEARSKVIDGILASRTDCKECKPVYEKYQKIFFKKTKEKFKQEHSEVARYEKAATHLAKHPDDKDSTQKELQEEQETLLEEIAELKVPLTEVQEDLKKLRDIRYWVRKATPGTEESKEPPKKQPIKEVLQDKADEKKAQRTAPAQAKHRQQDMEL